MSKKKRNNIRPKPVKPRLEEQLKRPVVFLFGALFVGILLWSSTKSDMSSLQWWQIVILGGMFLLGIYLMLIALFPRQKQVNRSCNELFGSLVRSIFSALLDKIL